MTRHKGWLVFTTLILVLLTGVVQASPCTKWFVGSNGQETIKVNPVVARVVDPPDGWVQVGRVQPSTHNRYTVDVHGFSKLYDCNALGGPIMGETLIIDHVELRIKVGEDYGRDRIVLPTFKVTVAGDVCSKTPMVVFYSDIRWPGGRAPRDARDIYTKLFYLKFSPRWFEFSAVFEEIFSKTCGSSPEAISVQIIPNFLVDKTPIYTGKYFLGEPYVNAWSDSDPEIRFRIMINDAIYQERVAAAEAERRKRQQAAWNATLSFSVGLVQGLTLEFGDEGVCGFLSGLSGSGYSRQSYVDCHNYLNDTLEVLQEDSTGFYVAGNLLGMLNSTYQHSSDSEVSEASAQAVAGCLDGMMREYGKTRIGESPDERAIVESCAFEGMLQGFGGAIVPNR